MEKNEAFLDAIEGIFLQSGFRTVTIAHLASKLRCSRRRLYDVAPSKDALFLIVLDRFFSNIRKEGSKQAEAHSEPEQQIGAYLQPGLDGAARLGPLFQKDISTHAEAQALYDEHQRLRMEGLRDLIKAGIDDKKLHAVNARIAAEMMLLIVQRIRTPEFEAEAGIGFSEALSEVYTLLSRGLIPDKSGPK
jgi:AcrR family transcriptional regulator